MHKKRSQTAIEFLTIFGFAFLMIIPVVIIFQTQTVDTKDALASNQIRNIEIKIVDKAEAMYYFGAPSKTTLRVYFPENIEEVEINNRIILFRYRAAENTLQEVVHTSLVNLTGTLSAESGLHIIEIEALGDSVSIADA
ncbi:hypothetical protein JW930_02725 [Candidatus Woesearchaeota archaeon]|nr:hypothetical protein [Candidatus Woesearchaeota archaeon]